MLYRHYILLLKVVLNDGFDAYRQTFFCPPFSLQSLHRLSICHINEIGMSITLYYNPIPIKASTPYKRPVNIDHTLYHRVKEGKDDP